VRFFFLLSSLLGSYLLSFFSFPLFFFVPLLSGGRGDEDAANEPIGTADGKRIKQSMIKQKKKKKTPRRDALYAFGAVGGLALALGTLRKNSA